MKLPLWTIIPVMFILTLLYLALGNNGYWNYSNQDFMFGNLLVVGIIGKCYGIEYLYKKYKKKWD